MSLDRASLSRVRRMAKRLLSPVTSGELRRAVDRLTRGGCEALYVHSGLSSLGHFVGGPHAAAGMLYEAAGTIFLPTHTYCYPPSADEPAVIFDPKTTPSSEMGLLAETFWRGPGVVRSIHSTHSLAGKGPLAAEICAAHYECDTPTGPGTPYSRLVHRSASALMLGVSFHYYTPFHTAEWESGSEFALEPGVTDRLRFIDENGRLQERMGRRQNRFASRFEAAGDLLERQGLVRREPLGRAALLFVPDMAKVHDFLLDRLRKHPDFLRQRCTAGLA